MGQVTAYLNYDEAGLFAEHPTDSERIERLAGDFAQVWTARASEARAAVEHAPIRTPGTFPVSDYASAQQAVDACAASGGGTVVLPVARQTLTETLVIPLNPTVRIVGTGARAALEQADPAWSSTLATGTPGMTLVKVGDGDNLFHAGPTFEGVAFENAAGGDATLVNVDMVNRATFRDCVFRGLETSVHRPALDHGLVMGWDYQQQPRGDCAWHTIDNCSFFGLGGDSLSCYGSLVLVGGEFTCADGGYAMRLRGGNYRILGPKVDNGLMVFNTQASTIMVHSEYHIDDHPPIVVIGSQTSDHNGWPSRANTFRGSVRASGGLAFALGEHAHQNEITAFLENSARPAFIEHKSATLNTVTLYDHVQGYPIR